MACINDDIYIGNMLSALKKKGVIKLVEKKKWVLVEV